VRFAVAHAVVIPADKPVARTDAIVAALHERSNASRLLGGVCGGVASSYDNIVGRRGHGGGSTSAARVS
jgi:hypothetical protein